MLQQDSSQHCDNQMSYYDARYSFEILDYYVDYKGF